MANNFCKEELLKLAAMAGLSLDENEVKQFEGEIKAIIENIDALENVTLSEELATARLENVFREDVVIESDADAILAQAPQTQDRYFVVPKILDEK
ncbi:MAG: Asp-tRNA(Asn)/Glu-tRNA(Gln) amidotransferase subunit GatC [Epsilonproteobacteria bacterium]|nr:Asp-tRNA(Asn)/Glu-tRNA(Gln) amidotransferase subunit GatC [Campylobacterota bacterium]